MKYFGVDLYKLQDVKYTYKSKNTVKKIEDWNIRLEQVIDLVNWTTIKVEIEDKVEFKRKITSP